MSLITYAANFDGNDLTTVTGLTVLASNPYQPAKRNLTTNPIARTNKSKVNSAFYNQRDITIRIGIVRNTRDLLEQSFDALMGLIQGREKDLVLRQAGSSRKYTATFADYVVYTEGGSYLEFDLVFSTSDHYGYDQNDTLLLQVTGFTSGNKTDQITLGGSAEWQVPKITLTFSAVGGATTKTVTLGNGDTGQAITVSRTWLAGDVLEIDSLNETVKINGTDISFTGAFPEWKVGVGYLTYADTFTSRTFSNTTTYKKRYA